MRYTKSLKGSINFKRILKQGKFASGKYICIYTKPQESSENTNLLGICVSKKHGNSVVRNKLKRWAREAYTSLEENLNKGYGIIVLYKKDISIDSINYWTVKDEIKDLFIKNELFIK